MRPLILYYSRSGNTKAFAGQKAKETGADIEQILDMKKLSMFAVGKTGRNYHGFCGWWNQEK